MTQPAPQLDQTPTLAQLLARELSVEALSSNLGSELASLEKYWQRALARPLCSLAERNGKELRARLLSIAWNMAGGCDPVPAELIGLIEGLHLGSLIVDDIEDGSSTRRGGPTLHEQVGLPLALNAANWLYFWPSLMIQRLGLSAHQELHLRRAVDSAVLNAHFGQALDLSLRITDLRQSEVARVVRACSELKTGCLMELAAQAGAMVAGSEANGVQLLGRMGRELGIALQMLDDLTSITSEHRVHKGHEDVRQARPTWPWAWLALTADEVGYGRLRMYEQRVFGGDADPDVVVAALRARVAEVGRAQVVEHLTGAVANVESALGNTDGFRDLKQWVSELAQYEG